MQSITHSALDAKDVRAIEYPGKASGMDKNEWERTLCAHALDDKGDGLSRFGFGGFDKLAAAGYGMDTIQNLLSTASIPVALQFLQQFLPGFVNVMTAARKIDEIVGINTAGSWEDEEVVQGFIENTGSAVPYTDLGNVPLASWNENWIPRTVVRFELGMRVNRLEEARAARIKVNSAQSKRESAGLALEQQRNAIGFYGYNSGLNQTYGFLNDPNLPTYQTVAATGSGGSTNWSAKTYLEITADLITMAATLQTQTQDTVNPEDVACTLVLATSVYQYLNTQTDFGISVRQFITQNYPKWRIVSAPQLNSANSSQNVAYLFADAIQDLSTDDGKAFMQIVPAKFQVLGVAQMPKGYEEDYSNATAGIFVKRPYLITRWTGL